MNVPVILQAMKADAIPAGRRGMWTVYKDLLPARLMLVDNGPDKILCTSLRRHTLETLHEDRGELVMIDHPSELRKHLEFVLQARGDVLVTGLGLGCVVRGLVARGEVQRVTVVERDLSVLALVAPHMPASVEIVPAEALEWCEATHRTFDYAWHDLWSDPDDERDDTLMVSHAKLIVSLKNKARRQGAWAFPRKFKRAYGTMA